MKRTVAAFALASGLVGCTSAPKAPTSAYPATADARGAAPDKPSGRTMTDPKRDASVLAPALYSVDRVTAGGDPNIRRVNGSQLDPQTYGPTQRGFETALGHGGIMPAPRMGPWGGVALVPGVAGGPGAMGGLYAGGRSSINFVSTPSTSKMRVGFQDASRGFVDVLAVPQHYNFVQGAIYRLRLSNIPNRPEAVLYPTLEVYPANKETVTFLSHSTVPVGFTDEDFDQVRTGNMVIKVIYLPSAQFQDIAAAEEIVSTRLQPGEDPVVEATRRGSVLAVVRMGNVNLENPNAPALDAPPPGMGMMPPPPGGMMMPPPAGPRPVPVPPAAPGGPMAAAPLPDVKTAPPPDLKADVKRPNLPADLPPISLPSAGGKK